MGKRFKHLNELRAKAMAGDVAAQTALQSMMYVPHHLRTKHKVRPGTMLTRGAHVTAKTHRTIACYASVGYNIDRTVERLNVLKVRSARREMRNAA